ncbi:hypothetical protein B296_00028778 [Ensete ventricosum]|uniref:RING-type domain-containing protein n=1 Tax=Ensete ventricosum TaxID=4639 RepID=A0A426Z3H1_ENSVE|nr:hypothetical protein B296_00028778 [Ensete ventricosum]
MGGRSSKSRGSNHYPQYVSTTSRGTSRYSSHPGAHDQPIATGRLQKKYSNIGDDYNSVEQVRIALWSSPCEVTHSVGTDHGQLSPQERDTINAIVKASAISVTCTNNVLRKQTCYDCGKDLNVCPICSCPIAKKIKLY